MPVEGQDLPGDERCPLCALQLDKKEEFIEGSCSACGEKRYHTDCIVDLMLQKCSKGTWKSSRGSREVLELNARRRPAHQFATVCGACPVEGCQGRIVGAESRKPAKQIVLPPAPAPFVPRSKQAAAAAAGKGKQGPQQQQAKAKPQATGAASAGPAKGATAAVAPAAKPRLVVVAATGTTKPVSAATAPAAAKQLPAPQEPKCDRLGRLLTPIGLDGRALGQGQGAGAEKASAPRPMTFAEEQALLLAAQEKQAKAKKAQKKGGTAPSAASSTPPAAELGPWEAAGFAPASVTVSEAEPQFLPEATSMDSAGSMGSVTEGEQGEDPWAALVARARSGFGSALSSGDQSADSGAASGGQGPSTPLQLPEPASTSSTPLPPSPLQPVAFGSPLLHVSSAPAALAAAPSMGCSDSGADTGTVPPWGEPSQSQWAPSLPTPAAAGSTAFDVGYQAGLSAALAQLGVLQGVFPAGAALPAAAVASPGTGRPGGFAQEAACAQPALWQGAGAHQALPPDTALGQEAGEGEADDLDLADMLALLGCGT